MNPYPQAKTPEQIQQEAAEEEGEREKRVADLAEVLILARREIEIGLGNTAELTINPPSQANLQSALNYINEALDISEELL